MTFKPPTDKEANQYASYIKKVGKFRIINWKSGQNPLGEIGEIMARLGWDLTNMSACMINGCVYIRDWYNISPLDKITRLNHESCHVGQLRKYGKWVFNSKYILDKDWRASFEDGARIRNLETRFMFGYYPENILIEYYARRLRTAYLLDAKHERRCRHVLTTVRKRLIAGTHRNVSAMFWRNFLRSKNKRQAIIR